MSEEIKCCPFCGGGANINKVYLDGWGVRCLTGHCPVNPEVDGYTTEADAIAAWNKRAEGDLAAPTVKPPADAAAVDAARQQVAKLQAFKDYVHKRLDDAGVPVDPESPHKAEGCRIGGRLDVLLADLAAARQRIGEMEKERGWVSIQERLPRPYDNVALSVPHPLIQEHMGWMNGDGTFRTAFVRELKNVTHWMPIPLGPNGPFGLSPEIDKRFGEGTYSPPADAAQEQQENGK